MTTAYPGAIDNLTNPTPSDPLNSATVPHAAQHANLNDAMEAVQNTLGTNPQGTSATVKDRIIAAEGAIINLNLAVDERVPGESGSNAPSAPLPNGYVWVNTSTNAVKVWNGTQFIDPSNAGGNQTSGLVLITAQPFTNAGAVSVNNCFSSTYRSYRVIVTARHGSATTSDWATFRLRASGTDLSAASYGYTVTQDGTQPTSKQEATNQTSVPYLFVYGDQGGAATFDITNPFESANTAWVGNAYSGRNLASYYQNLMSFAGGYWATTPADGFTLGFAAASGVVSVYGYRN